MKIFSQKKNTGFTHTLTFTKQLCCAPLAHCKSKCRGFTLVETLVAISIFTMSILGLMSVLTSGIADTSYAKKKMVATYLAQEGIEYVRNIRDTNVIPGGASGWSAFTGYLGTGGCAVAAAGCYVNNMVLSQCTGAGGSCQNLSYDDTTGTYGYGGSTDSGFSRKITVTIGTNEVKIISTVSWTQGSGPQSITFSEYLYNWVP